jgi:hypothetical protein
MKKLILAAVVMAVTLSVGGAVRADDSAQRQCVMDAAKTKNTCTQMCRDDFQVAVDTCRNVDHQCADTARSNRDSCVSSVLAALKQCTDDNCSMFQDLIQQCRANNPPDSKEREACIDGVQVQNFQCRDQCRESVKLFSSLKACRDEFRADIKNCALSPN